MIALPLGIVAALASSGETSWMELEPTLVVDARTMSDPMRANAPSGDALGINATLGITVFGRRVVDDDAAPPLQPFLQLAPRFHLEAGGGHATTHFPAYAPSAVDPIAFMTRYTTHDDAGYFDASADGTIARRAYVAAALRLRYDSWGTDNYGGGIVHASSSELLIDASLAAGARWRDLLVFGGWSVTPYRVGADAFAVRFWGGAFAGVRAVVRRRWDLAARVDVLDSGARGEASATFWLRRRFGFTLAVEGGHGAFADSPVTFDRAGGRVAFAWWLAPRLAASLAYAPAWQSATPVAGLGGASAEFRYVAHVITLTLTSRPPLSRQAVR